MLTKEQAVEALRKLKAHLQAIAKPYYIDDVIEFIQQNPGQEVERKIVQISAMSAALLDGRIVKPSIFALDNNGIVWNAIVACDEEPLRWKKLPPIRQN